MRIRAHISLSLMLAATVLAAPSVAEDSTSTKPVATTGYTAPSAGAAQTAATAARAIQADRAANADRAARADVADSLSQPVTPVPTPEVQTGYVCGGGGKPRCTTLGVSLSAGVYQYSCYRPRGEDTINGTFIVRVSPAFGSRYGGCGSTTAGIGLYLRGGSLYWVKRVG